MYLRNIVAYLGTLEQTVFVLIILYKIYTFPKSSKIISNPTIRVFQVYVSIKFHKERDSKTRFGFETCLDACNIFISMRLTRKLSLEIIICEYLFRHCLLLSNNCNIFVVVLTTIVTKICL